MEIQGHFFFFAPTAKLEIFAITKKSLKNK